MDQLSQRSSSERTQFMSREDLDQEGSLDLEHDHYHYQDQDQDQDHYTDQELELQERGQDQRHTRGANISTPTKTLELKVQNERIRNCTNTHKSDLIIVLTYSCPKLVHFSLHSMKQQCKLNKHTLVMTYCLSYVNYITLEDITEEHPQAFPSAYFK